MGSRGIYDRFSCREERNEFSPLPHQKHSMQAFLDSKFKGMMLYHGLGSGKTCTSILIGDALLKNRLVDRVYVLSPGSLRVNWIDEYCKKCGYKSKYLKKYYTFITYNYNVGKNLPDFSKSLVIVDEFHNVINGTINNSSTARAIFSALYSSDCRILLLSGTPVREPSEFALIGALLKPTLFKNPIVNNKIYTGSFTSLFEVDDENRYQMENPKMVEMLLKGVISYYSGDIETIPVMIEREPIKVEMSLEQETNYWIERVKEMKLMSPVSLKIKARDPELYKLLSMLHIMALKRIPSRTASNFYYMPEMVKLPDTLIKYGGWVKDDCDSFNDGQLSIYSKKFQALMLNIALNIETKHVICTSLKEKSGANLLKTMFDTVGIKCALFTGDLTDTQRNQIVSLFNNERNRNGEYIKVLVITEAAFEGISLKEVRHVHILESSPRIGKTMQAIGRVVRYQSHEKLKKEDRNVNVWRYWSVASPYPVTVTTEYIDDDGIKKTTVTTINDKITVDQQLYEKGEIEMELTNSFLEILQSFNVLSKKKRA